MPSSLCLVVLDRLIRDIPRVPTTPAVWLHRILLGLASRMQVALVHEGHSNRKALKRHLPRLREVEDALVRHVDEALRVDRLEMPMGDIAQTDVLHPGELILKHIVLPESIGNVHRDPWLDARIANVQEERPLWSQDTLTLAEDISNPREVDVVRLAIIRAPVVHPKVIGRRGHDTLHVVAGELSKPLKHIAFKQLHYQALYGLHQGPFSTPNPSTPHPQSPVPQTPSDKHPRPLHDFLQTA